MGAIASAWKHQWSSVPRVCIHDSKPISSFHVFHQLFHILMYFFCWYTSYLKTLNSLFSCFKFSQNLSWFLALEYSLTIILATFDGEGANSLVCDGFLWYDLIYGYNSYRYNAGMMQTIYYWDVYVFVMVPTWHHGILRDWCSHYFMGMSLITCLSNKCL